MEMMDSGNHADTNVVFGEQTGFQFKRSNGPREDELKISANAARKAKVHGHRVIAMLYCFLILSTGLAISLLSTGVNPPESNYSFVWFHTLLYFTSVVAMIYMLTIILKQRNASIEAVEKGDLSARRILFSMRGEAVSMYLRIGLCIFAVMSIVFTVSRAIEAKMNGAKWNRIIPYSLGKVLFFTVQPIFLLILHRIVVLSNVRRFSFILLHLLTVSLCIWVESVIDKISRTMKPHHSPNGHTNDTKMNGPETRSKLDVSAATGYFLPAVPEYCAISAAVIYEMAQRIGQLKQIEAHHEQEHSTKSKIGARRHASIIVGIAIILLILTIILATEVLGPVIKHKSEIIHSFVMGAIIVSSVCLSIHGTISMQKLKFSVNFAKNGVDEKLLLVTFFFTVNFFCVAIVLCVGYLRVDAIKRNYQQLVATQLFTVLFELMQVLVQTYFIHDMFYRCCHHEAYEQKKPGRTSIVILAAMNFALWMIYSFGFKHNAIFFKEELQAYTTEHLRGLTICFSAMLPMVMLFRYHSSVCLAISYTRVYEDEVTRYENMLRWVKQDSTKEFLHKQKNSLANIWVTHDSPNQMLQKREEKRHSGDGTKIQVHGNSLLGVTIAVPHPQELEEAKSRKRRNTKFNLEMARSRLAASEAILRNTEMKLKQQRIKENKCAQILSNVIEEDSNRNSVDQNISRN